MLGGMEFQQEQITSCIIISLFCGENLCISVWYALFIIFCCAVYTSVMVWL